MPGIEDGLVGKAVNNPIFPNQGLNSQPLDVQLQALPLSYIPCAENIMLRKRDIREFTGQLYEQTAEGENQIFPFIQQGQNIFDRRSLILSVKRFDLQRKKN